MTTRSKISIESICSLQFGIREVTSIPKQLGGHMWFFLNLEEGHIVGMNVKMNKIRVGGFVLYFLILCPITPKKIKITMKILKVQKHDEISNFFPLGHLCH